jgi:hypothetical protein
VCRFSSSFWRCWWRLVVGTLGFWELDSILEPVASLELSKEVFTSRARWIPLIVEWNTFTDMFYLLKHLLLLILIIFKLKCNNLILNEIIVLNTSYVCLHAFLLRQESPDLDPRWWTPHFWGGSVTIVITCGALLDCGCRIVRFIPLQSKLNRVTKKPSNTGGTWCHTRF